MRRALAPGALLLAASCGGSTPPPASLPPPQASPVASAAATGWAAAAEPPLVLADGPTWDAWRRADELVLAPHRFAEALAPLVRHRTSQGHVVAMLDVESLFERLSHGQPDARALQKAVRALAAHVARDGGGSLRYVLLAGDSDELPTFYLRKGAYEHHTPEEHDNPHAITRAEHAAYPSDDPYGRLRDTDLPATTPPPIAVGRVPARSPAELSAFVRKVVAYETAPLTGDQTWRRRLTLYAGDPYFGPMGDEVVQSVAQGILDADLTYDFDLRLTFAKETSPYAYGFDRLERKFVDDMDDGAIVAAYVGHGSVTRFAPAEFRGRRYEVGTADDAAAMHIADGKPVFFSIACDTGAFDRPAGLPSLAERMILNEAGPVAVVASSRESHPYPNALYGQAIIRTFANGRPATVGDGVLAVKDGMLHGSMAVADLLLGDDVDALKSEHVGLYNLFGDPATRLRYPGALTVTAEAAVARGSFGVDVAADGFGDGKVRVTIETRRGAMKGPIVPAASLASMAPPEAFAAMAHNNAVANDKVVAVAEADLHSGHAHVAMRAPEAGDYVVKAFALGADAAVGHAELKVAPGP